MLMKLSDAKASAVTTNNYVGEAVAGQTIITPGFTWRTTWTGIVLYIDGVKQAPGSYTVNSIGGGLSSQVTLSEALVGGETIDFTALDISSVPSLQGIVDKLALQSTQVTNAGFGVWSNGTLESAVSSVNLITNGEFETDTSGWTAGNGATLTRDTTTSANGSACLKITNSGATYGGAYQAKATVAGRVYKAVCYAKCGTATYALIAAGTTAASMIAATGDIASINTTSTSGFVRLEIVFEAVGATTYVGVYQTNVSGGTAYYDSITLYDMGVNLVDNGTFNSNTTGWTTQGSSSISSVAGGINGNHAQATLAAGNYIYSQITGLVVGKLYRVSAWLKNGTASGPTLLGGSSIGAKNLFGLNDSYASVASYTYFTALFEADATSMYLSMYGGTTGTVFFDTITLTEVTVGCVDYNTKALDLWTKDKAVCCWRETIDTKEGSLYALRVYNGQVYWSDGNRAAKPEFYKRYVGREAAIGMWVKCSAANKARIGVTDSAGTTWSSYHSGGGSYEWLEVTRTPGAGITSYNIVLDSGTSTEAKFSQPQLQFGTSIGQGNFVPMVDEVIRFPTVMSTKLPYVFKSAQLVMLPINPAVDSGGVIPSGAKSVFLSVFMNDSAMANQKFIINMVGGTIDAPIGSNVGDIQIGCSNPSPSTNTFTSGVAPLVNGVFYAGWNAGGTNTALPLIRYTGVQL